MSDDLLHVAEGLATFGEKPLKVLRRLDDAIVSHAQDCGATAMQFPALTAVAMLDRIDYFMNFPHLGVATAPLSAQALRDMCCPPASPRQAISSAALADCRYFLPSAACYPAYAYLAGSRLTSGVRLTMRQSCFRNEERYEGLARLWSFSMREIVFVGTQSAARDFLAANRSWVLAFAEAAGIHVTPQVATDPFFEPSGERAKMQKLFPVKEEFVCDDGVAISSINFHRNFFAERWNISTTESQYAFSGCVAFGLERWLHALIERYEQNWQSMLQAIDAAAGAQQATRTLAAAP